MYALSFSISHFPVHGSDVAMSQCRKSISGLPHEKVWSSPTALDSVFLVYLSLTSDDNDPLAAADEKSSGAL